MVVMFLSLQRFLRIRLSPAGRRRLDTAADMRASIARRLTEVVNQYRHLAVRGPAAEEIKRIRSVAPAAASTGGAATASATR